MPGLIVSKDQVAPSTAESPLINRTAEHVSGVEGTVAELGRLDKVLNREVEDVRQEVDEESTTIVEHDLSAWEVLAWVILREVEKVDGEIRLFLIRVKRMAGDSPSSQDEANA